MKPGMGFGSCKRAVIVISLNHIVSSRNGARQECVRAADDAGRTEAALRSFGAPVIGKTA
jgi:hypothetical protein